MARVSEGTGQVGETKTMIVEGEWCYWTRGQGSKNKGRLVFLYLLVVGRVANTFKWFKRRLLVHERLRG